MANVVIPPLKLPTGTSSGGTTKKKKGVSAATAASRARTAKRNNPATLAAIITRELNMPFDVSKYVDQAIRQYPSASDTYALVLIEKSPEFKAHFPGIFRHDGTLRMSPAQYMATTDRYQETAHQYGVALTRAELGQLVTSNKDPGEFRNLIQGIIQIKSNPSLIPFLNQQIDQVNTYRHAHRIPLIKRVNNLNDAVAFAIGTAPNNVYGVYNGALYEAAQKSAGLKVDAKDAARLATQSPGTILKEGDLEKSYSQIAMDLHKAAPELGLFGMQQKELETIEFGGPNRAALAAKAKQAMDQQAGAEKATLAQPRVTLDSKFGERPVLQGGSPTPGA